jgi:hypothetical protein
MSDLPNNKAMRRRQAVAFLNDHGFPIALATLETLATRGGGPPMTYFGSIPTYSPDGLLEWARSRCRVKRSTSDPGAPVAA